MIHGGKVEEKKNQFLNISRTNDLSPHFVNWKSKLKVMYGIKRVGKQKQIEKSGLNEGQSDDMKTGSWEESLAKFWKFTDFLAEKQCEN